MDQDDAPATKRDLAQLEERLNERFDSRLQRMQAELQEQMRDMQTELLKAFPPWQENIQMQFQKLKTNTQNDVQEIQQRMDILERRLYQIERKLLLEPPAA